MEKSITDKIRAVTNKTRTEASIKALEATLILVTDVKWTVTKEAGMPAGLAEKHIREALVELKRTLRALES